MKLKKCPKCKSYTLDDKCKKCGSETKDAHYKFLGMKIRKNSEEKS
jgi:RNA polymerase subunit RPABC4/transcription elongation factor Spt4